MTIRLYYTDAYLSTFTATVTDVITVDGRSAVVLDRTAFYPTSGGQPFDTGWLGGLRIEDVVDLEDGRVAHLVGAPLPLGAEVNGVVDWPRRFEHMQQHTGQHVLSAAFVRALGARTESFHLGSEVSTIDFGTSLSPGQIAAAEDEANRVVWEDRPVRVRFVSDADAAALPLRKEPARGGELRLVDIEGVDLTACGGTHVTSTGAIGMIAVAGSERFKGGTRLEFVCGGRALGWFRRQRDIVVAAVRHLSVLPSELPGAILRLQDDLKAHRQATRGLQQRLARYDAQACVARGCAADGLRAVIERVEGWDAAGLKALATEIAAHPGHAAVLVSGDTPALVVIARSANVGLDATAVLKALTARFGGKGGGRPELAQGGGLAAPHAEILSEARALLGVT
jgi:alanyl-tRNA synthetase